MPEFFSPPEPKAQKPAPLNLFITTLVNSIFPIFLHYNYHLSTSINHKYEICFKGNHPDAYRILVFLYKDDGRNRFS